MVSIRALGPASPLMIEPNFKWQFYSDETRGLAAAAGVLFLYPSPGERMAPLLRCFMPWAVRLSGDIRSSLHRGRLHTRRLAGTGDDEAWRLTWLRATGTSKISFLADWASGNNDYGYVVAGTGITLSSKDSFMPGITSETMAGETIRWESITAAASESLPASRTGRKQCMPPNPVSSPCSSTTGLHCEVYGSGAPILAVHGLGACVFSWRKLKGRLPDHKLILIDLKGHGESPKPPDTHYAIPDQAELF